MVYFNILYYFSMEDLKGGHSVMQLANVLSFINIFTSMEIHYASARDKNT